MTVIRDRRARYIEVVSEDWLEYVFISTAHLLIVRRFPFFVEYMPVLTARDHSFLLKAYFSAAL